MVCRLVSLKRCWTSHAKRRASTRCWRPASTRPSPVSPSNGVATSSSRITPTTCGSLTLRFAPSERRGSPCPTSRRRDMICPFPDLVQPARDRFYGIRRNVHSIIRSKHDASLDWNSQPFSQAGARRSLLCSDRSETGAACFRGVGPQRPAGVIQ